MKVIELAFQASKKVVRRNFWDAWLYFWFCFVYKTHDLIRV